MRSGPAIIDRTDPTTALGQDEFYSHDIVESFRHDFGDIVAYTIDDADTADVDDGISIEDITNPDGSVSTWVHVHVADPTRYIHPNHSLAKFARRQVAIVISSWANRPYASRGIRDQNYWSQAK